MLALDAVPERLELASSFGAHPLPVTDAGAALTAGEIAEEARRIVGSEGVECVVDAVGSPAATRTAVELLRPGGFLSIVGVHTEQAFDVTPAAAYDKNLTLAIGRCPVRSRLDEVCAVQVRERLPIEKLVTHRIPLSEAADAYRMFSERRDGIIKAVFDPR